MEKQCGQLILLARLYVSRVGELYTIAMIGSFEWMTPDARGPDPIMGSGERRVESINEQRRIGL